MLLGQFLSRGFIVLLRFNFSGVAGVSIFTNIETLMYNDITRIMKGLEILSKYKADADINGVNNSTWFLSAQEEAFLSISDEDRSQLIKYGWRQRSCSPYMWILATAHGLSIERDSPEWFE